MIGNTFTNLNLVNDAIFFFTLTMASMTQGAISGVSIDYPADSYTVDGVNWTPSLQGKRFWIEQVQSAQLVGNVTGDVASYGLAGAFTNTIQGVAVSSNGGKSFNVFSVPFKTSARNAAFPTPTTWYVTGGNIPNNTNNFIEDGKIRLTNKYSMKTNHKGNIRRLITPNPKLNLTNILFAEVWKTTDGGQTFTQIFNATNYCAGDIRCSDENNCFMLMESATNSQVWATKDGGMSWTTLYTTAPNAGFVIGWMNSAMDWWIGGGDSNNDGLVVHTADGGSTWESMTVPETIVFSLSMSNATYGFFTGPNPLSLFQLFKFSA